jgi:hypothetical protein
MTQCQIESGKFWRKIGGGIADIECLGVVLHFIFFKICGYLKLFFKK